MFKPQNYLHSTGRMVAASAATLGIATVFLAPSALAGRIGNRVYFDSAPRLTRSVATNRGPSRQSTYQFTIYLPDNAGEPLEAVRFTPRDHLEDIALEVDESSAFEGDTLAGGPNLPLSSIGGTPEVSGEVTVVFDPPVSPGRSVTVELETEHNPGRGGVYLYGVTAYPDGGELAEGIFLGYGRLHFFDDEQ
ncbi:MAG: DUF2808 domain-containing protein [Elainellaceae cyanobacterium]